MTPQLWTRNLSWLEWRQMHPDLEDREAEYLYKVELKMFQNYQDELRNQTTNRQNRLAGDLLNLSADISTILTEGGVYTPPRRYIMIQGIYDTFQPFVGIAVGRDLNDLNFQMLVGDEFVYDFSISTNPAFGNARGTYRVITDTLFEGTDRVIGTQTTTVANRVYAGIQQDWIKISDSTIIDSNVDF